MDLDEAKCKEMADGINGLENTIYDIEFFNLIQKIPKGATLKTFHSAADRFGKGRIADKRKALSALGSNSPSTDEKCLK